MGMIWDNTPTFCVHVIVSTLDLARSRGPQALPLLFSLFRAREFEKVRKGEGEPGDEATRGRPRPPILDPRSSAYSLVHAWYLIARDLRARECPTVQSNLFRTRQLSLLEASVEFLLGIVNIRL